MNKSLLYGGIFACLIIAFFIISAVFRSPCDTIFDQDSSILDVKLDVVKKQGEALFGTERLKNFTERSEMMAMNLKTCCIALHEEKIGSADFLRCKETFQSYVAGLDQLSTQINKVQEAKTQDQTQAAQSRLETANQFLKTATLQSKQFSSLVSYIVDRTPTSRPWADTEFPGVIAEVSRFEDTKGMVTLEVIFNNIEDSDVSFWVNPSHSYLIDEKSRSKWNDKFRDGDINSYYPVKLPPGRSHTIWMKFPVDKPYPEEFTAVVDKVVRPFERLVIKN